MAEQTADLVIIGCNVITIVCNVTVLVWAVRDYAVMRRMRVR
jgi:hypothetical protein